MMPSDIASGFHADLKTYHGPQQQAFVFSWLQTHYFKHSLPLKIVLKLPEQAANFFQVCFYVKDVFVYAFASLGQQW